MSIPRPIASTAPASPSTSSTFSSFAARVVEFWWVSVPRAVGRFSRTLGSVCSDAPYWSAWPRTAAVLLLAIFLFGFAEGATHWSYRTIVGTNGFAGNVIADSSNADGYGGPTRLIFADNLLLLLVAVGVGTLSANFGLALVLGYFLGDLLHALPPTQPGWRLDNDPFNAWIYRHVPLFTSYVLFFLLACLCIVMASALARSFPVRAGKSPWLLALATAILHALLIFCWGVMAPMVFRNVLLWIGGDPRITVPFYRDVVATWLVPTGFIAVFIRLALTAVANKQPLRAQRIAATQRRAYSRPAAPVWARALMLAGVITLLLLGFTHTPARWAPHPLTNFGEAELVFAGLLIALLVRAYWFPRQARIARWSAAVEQYPAALRLAAAALASYILCLILIAIPGVQSSAPGEFGPELASVLFGIAASLLLLPNGWLTPRESSRWLPGVRLAVPSRATQAGLITFFVLLAARKAFADCYDYACCMISSPTVAAAAAAGAVPALGGLASGLTKPDPCERERNAVQAAQDKVDELQGAIDGQQSALNTLEDQVAQQFAQLQAEALAALGESALDPPLNALVSQLWSGLQTLGTPTPATQTQFFSNPALASVINGLSAQAAAGPSLATLPPPGSQVPLAYPTTTAFLQGFGPLPGEISTIDGLMNSLRDLEQQLQDAKSALANAQATLAKCEAAHATPRKS